MIEQTFNYPGHKTATVSDDDLDDEVLIDEVFFPFDKPDDNADIAQAMDDAMSELGIKPEDLTVLEQPQHDPGEPFMEYEGPNGRVIYRNPKPETAESDPDAPAEEVGKSPDADTATDTPNDPALADQPPAVREILAASRDAFDAKLVAQADELTDANRRTMDALGQVAEPMQPYLAALGLSLPDVAGRLLASHHRLTTASPEERQAMFELLAREYRVDFSRLPPEMDPQLDPQERALFERLGRVESYLARQGQQQASQTRQQVQAQASDLVDRFAAARDEAGRLKHPHFNRVQDQMAVFMTEQGLDLEEAYDRAIWSDPDLRRELQRTASPPRRKARQTKSQKQQARPRARDESLEGDIRRAYAELAEG